ncbi:MAG: alpha/beta hydrolase [Bacteroidetes bacterium]|nr:alpha/beta hydrolase [Bacteroidota bacterium]
MSKRWWWLIIPAILVILFLLGPAPATPVYDKTMPTVPSDAAGLETYIRDREAKHRVKTDNEARIVWADSSRQKTPYVLVYLHGFSASQGEGDAIHRWAAEKLHANLYLTRLAEHGIDTVDAMVNLTADNYWESARDALAVARQLGEKVILMGTSTGGTLALQLAAAYPNDVFALVLMSPNIAINDPNAWLLNDHWGLQIARMVTKSNYITTKEDYGPLYRQYWYTKYRSEAVVALEELVETSMKKSTFSKVTQPVGLFYYYKDSVHQDSTVKVSAELEMFDQLGTPAPMKYKKAIPEAGTHVIGSSIRSHDVEGVKEGVAHFIKEVAHIPMSADTVKHF